MKLTKTLLKRMIAEEAAKFGAVTSTEDAADDTEEVDADELADSLDKKINYVKALKIEEARLLKRVQKVRETRIRVLKSVR